MSDPTNNDDGNDDIDKDELAMAERLRATFDAEAATLTTRRQAEVRPASVRSVPGAHQRPTARTGWRRSVIPIAAALMVVAGIVGVASFTQRQDADSEPGNETVSDVVAPQENTSPPFAASVGAITEPNETGAGQGIDEPTVTGGLQVPDVSDDPAAQIPMAVAITEFCVTGIVAPDTLNLRAEPTIEGELLGELSPGQCGIEQLAPPQDGWTSIRVHDRSGGQIEGWVSARYVTSGVGPDRLASAPEYCVTGINAPDTLSLRTGPSVDAAEVARLKPDRCGIAWLAPPTSGWFPIQVTGPFGSLYVGYVAEQFVTPFSGGITGGGFQRNMVDRPSCAISGQPNVGVALRIGPSADSFVVADLASNECEVFPSGDTDETGQWSRVSVASINRGGWVPTQTLRATEEFVQFAPGTQMTRVKFDLRLDPRFYANATAPVDPTHFRVLSPDSRTIGTLGPDAAIDLPVDLDPETLTIAGYRTDKYCLTTGRPTAPSSGTYSVNFFPELCV